jgi:hypothetical protein
MITGKGGAGQKRPWTTAKENAGTKPALPGDRKMVYCGRLDFSIGIGADFAVEVDFFVLRCGPFHGLRLLGVSRSG